MPFAAGASSSAVIGGQIYVAGGIVGSSTTTQAARYNPATNSWTSIAPMPQGRNHAASATNGSKLYVFGGRGPGSGDSNVVENGFDTVQVYDPATNTWSSSAAPNATLAPLPQARGGTGKAVFHNGEFYVMGGETKTGAGATVDRVYDRVDVYKPQTNTWRLSTPMPTARHGIFPLLIADRMYVAGGGVKAGFSASSALEVYNTSRPDGVAGVGSDRVSVPVLAGTSLIGIGMMLIRRRQRRNMTALRNKRPRFPWRHDDLNVQGGISMRQLSWMLPLLIVPLVVGCGVPDSTAALEVSPPPSQAAVGGSHVQALPPVAAAPGSAGTGDAYHIGVIVSTSGNNVDRNKGKQHRKKVLDLVDAFNVNQRGLLGPDTLVHPVVIHVLDDGGRPKVADELARRLIADQGVVALISTNATLKKVSREEHVPVILIGKHTKDSPWDFSIEGSDADVEATQRVLAAMQRVGKNKGKIRQEIEKGFIGNP